MIHPRTLIRLLVELVKGWLAPDTCCECGAPLRPSALWQYDAEICDRCVHGDRGAS